MNTTEIIITLIGLLCTIITTFVIPYIKAKTNTENAKAKYEEFLNLVEEIKEYVNGAEQLLGAGTGEQKKKLVVELLERAGVVVDKNVDAIIEAAVFAINEIKEKAVEK